MTTGKFLQVFTDGHTWTMASVEKHWSSIKQGKFKFVIQKSPCSPVIIVIFFLMVLLIRSRLLSPSMEIHAFFLAPATNALNAKLQPLNFPRHLKVYKGYRGTAPWPCCQADSRLSLGSATFNEVFKKFLTFPNPILP